MLLLLLTQLKKKCNLISKYSWLHIVASPFLTGHHVFAHQRNKEEIVRPLGCHARQWKQKNVSRQSCHQLTLGTVHTGATSKIQRGGGTWRRRVEEIAWHLLVGLDVHCELWLVTRAFRLGTLGWRWQSTILCRLHGRPTGLADIRAAGQGHPRDHRQVFRWRSGYW